MTDTRGYDERDEALGKEIVKIVGEGRRAAMLAALHAMPKRVQPPTPPEPVVEPPAVSQVRRLKVTRKAPAVEVLDLEKATPEQRLAHLRRRWRKSGVPFIGRRQMERQQRQAARAAGYDPTSRTHYSGSELIPDVTDAEIANARTNDAAPDLMPCPRCNQYNPRTNYACRVCGFEFGIST